MAIHCNRGLQRGLTTLLSIRALRLPRQATGATATAVPALAASHSIALLARVSSSSDDKAANVAIATKIPQLRWRFFTTTTPGSEQQPKQKEQQQQTQHLREHEHHPQQEQSPSTQSALPNHAELEEKLHHLVQTTPVVLFLKGRPEAPLCGFSSQAVLLLEAAGAEQYTFVDCSVQVNQPPVLQQKRQHLRSAVQRLFDWHTLPLLVVRGTVIGGSDIMQQLHEQGQLSAILKGSTSAANPSTDAPCTDGGFPASATSCADATEEHLPKHKTS